MVIDVFTAAPHHDVLKLVFQIGILLFTARALGEIAGRLKQPSVVGEILAGILLGPSLLSSAFPALGHWIVPDTEVQGYLLEVVSLVGAMFLLLITGLETDLRLIRRHARTAIGVSLGGILVTFSSGFALGQHLPDFLLGDPDKRLTFALFIGTAMSISAIPVIAKVMMDLNLMRRDIGQTIIAAGMSDDTIGWILLSVVAGLAAGEAVTAGSVLQAVGSVAAFMVLSFTVGRWLVKRALDLVQDKAVSRDRLLTLVVVLTFVWGGITQALNLEAVLGAFVMGILFGTMPRLPVEVHQKLESISLGIFTPIFFAVAGLKVNLLNLLEPRLLLIALVVIAIATLGKVVGTYIGARVVGRQGHWTSLAFGAGLNARGAMEIIIATIGLSLGILSQDMFSIIVLMAMATSLMAPSALRFVLARVTMSDEESQRLRREELALGSQLAQTSRVLLPVRLREGPGKFDLQHIEQGLINRLGSNVAVTLLTISETGKRAQGVAFLNELSSFFPEQELSRRVLEGNRENAVDLILDEAAKDYDLIILGATEGDTSGGALFNPIIDRVMRLAPCPIMVVKAVDTLSHWPPKSILVPTNGSVASRQAAEVAFTLAQTPSESSSVRVRMLNVLTEEHTNGQVSAALHERRFDNAYRIVDGLRELGEAQAIHTESTVRQGRSVAEVVLDIARKQHFDLIILGTDLRPGSERLFLGPSVESILEKSPCPVIIYNSL